MGKISRFAVLCKPSSELKRKALQGELSREMRENGYSSMCVHPCIESYT